MTFFVLQGFCRKWPCASILVYLLSPNFTAQWHYIFSRGLSYERKHRTEVQCRWIIIDPSYPYSTIRLQGDDSDTTHLFCTCTKLSTHKWYRVNEQLCGTVYRPWQFY